MLRCPYCGSKSCPANCDKLKALLYPDLLKLIKK